VAAPVFNGSAIIEATLVGGGGPANVVAAVDEYYTTSNIAAAFEGLPLADAAGTIYMSTGLCERFGLDTFYAVTNASLTDSTDITVTYYGTNGAEVATDGPYSVGAGEKRSIRTCDPNDGTDMSNFSGSAVISSSATDIVVIGKAQN